MSDDNDTKRFGKDDESLAGDALLHAVLRDVKGLFGLVKALDEKVDARLHDTTPMWEIVVSRLDTVVAEQESQGRRLDAIEAEQRRQGARFDAIETRLDAIEIKLERFDAIDRELRHLGRRIERTIAELSGDFVKFRVDQRDFEDRLEKLEKTPA
jgi:chromosome segregation ATPase